MPHELDKILIKYDQPDFIERSTKIRADAFSSTNFVFDSEKEKQLEAISRIHGEI
jgi:hypothetical protein